MEKYLKKSLSIVSLLMVLLLVACAPANTSNNQGVESEASENLVVDMMGREFVFDGVPERVVALNPSDMDILTALGVEDKVVGRGSYVELPEGAEDIPVVATGQDLNAEEILALEPDVVFTTDMGYTKEQMDTFDKMGIPVIVTNAKILDQVYESIEIFGSAMDREEKAGEVINEMKDFFENLPAQSESLKGKKVYFEISPLEYGLWSAGKGTFMDEISTIMGMENIFADINGWDEVSEEAVIERDPDIIVTNALFEEGDVMPVDEIMSRKGWENVSAVKNKQVIQIENDELSIPSPRLMKGAEALLEFANEN